MSIKIEMYMLVGRKYLEEYYNSSFKQFENCCGVCWCCIRKKQKKILAKKNGNCVIETNRFKI